MRDLDLNFSGSQVDLSNATGTTFNPCKGCPFGKCWLCAPATTDRWKPFKNVNLTLGTDRGWRGGQKF